MLFAVLSTAVPHAQPASGNSWVKIFQIGSFDRSSGEFNAGTPGRNVEFNVSKSEPQKDWYALQPAAMPSAGGPQQGSIPSAPRAITFTLAGRPTGDYELHLALLVENPVVPAVKVVINGRAGLFYLHPRLDYSNGDQWDSFDPAYSAADLLFTFPGRYLKQGANRITLQFVNQAEDAAPSAGLHYDAIELDRVPAQPAAQTFSAQLEPTIFYRVQDGVLKEEIDSFIRAAKGIKPGGKAELTIGHSSYQAVLKGGYEFGEERIEFQAREFEPGTAAKLTISLGGPRRQFEQTLTPAKKWTLFLVPNIHLDVGYSDYQAKVAAIQSRVIGEAVDMAQAHPGFSFSMDGEWSLRQFFETHTEAQKQRAIEAIKKRQVYIPAQYVNLLTGIASTETLIRSLYPSANFSRQYGTPFDYANITDVPSFSWSYASVLASAGIPCLAAGSDNYRAPVLFNGRLNENSPLWWEGPDGKKVLLWYSRHYMHLQLLFGQPPVLSAGRDKLPLFLQMYGGARYKANSTILYGTQVENSDLFPQQAELVEKWNSVYAYPRIKYSGFHDALVDVARQFGDAIPVIRGDGAPYWEDGAASDAYYLALERWNEARGQTAEKLDTLAALYNPLLKADAAELERMWTNMVLMDEHTFDSWDSVSDPGSGQARQQHKFKEQFATNAAAQVDFVTTRSMANLADVIPASPVSVIVFNTLNWRRGGLVTVDVNKPDEIIDPATNQPVACEVVASGDNTRTLRFLAKDVPAMGYKVYRTQPGKLNDSAGGKAASATLENQFYKLQLDPESGAIQCIYDKQLNKELVSRTSPYRFGEYLYVTGGDKYPNSIHVNSALLPAPALEVHQAHGGHLVSIERTPSGTVALMESEDVNTPLIRTRVRLFNDEKKIELTEEVDKKEVLNKEAVYFAFPFALNKPRFQYEVQNGVVDPAKDTYPGAGHEWFTVQHWIAAGQDGVSGGVLPLDAPLVTLGDINRGAWPAEFGQRDGTIFSYVMNNYWNTNYLAGQGGHFAFHYVITSAASTDAAALSRMGWEEITPLEADVVTTQDKPVAPPAPGQKVGTAQATQAAGAGKSPRQLSATEGSFIEISDPNILLETWKPAEDGNGTILRFVDFGGTERGVSVKIPALALAHVWQTDAVERGRRVVPIAANGQFLFTIHPHEIVTLRLVPAGN